MKCVAAFFSLALTFGSQASQADHILDLVGYLLAPSDGKARGTPPGVSGTSGGERPKAALTLTLLSLDRLSYRPGTTMIYEVLIENVGTEPVTMPWSPDYGLFHEELFLEPNVRKSSVRQAVIFLDVRDRTGSQQLARLELQGLYGSQSVAGSLTILAPRQKAWIRVPGFWPTSTVDELAPLLKQQEGLVRVGAEFDLANEVLRVRSNNTIEVTLEVAQEP